MKLHQQLDRGAVKLWKVSAVIEGLIACTLMLLAQLILLAIGVMIWIHWFVWAAILITVAVVALYLLFIAQAKYDNWTYSIAETGISLQQGFLFRSRTEVPMNRVQQVTLKQGPIKRKYRLATVEIATAAGIVEIPVLEISEAEQTCIEINRLALLSDQYE